MKLAIAFCAALTAYGQAQVDFSALTTKTIESGTTASLPSTCSSGQMYFVLDAPAGANVYGCTAFNTWTLQGGFTISSNGAAIGSASNLNLVSGSGVTVIVTPVPGHVNVQLGTDASIPTQASLQSGSALLCASTSASPTNYTCSMLPTLPEYTNGMTVNWRPDVALSGGPTTLNIDTLGAVSIKMADGVSDPPATPAGGRIFPLSFDGSVMRFPAISIAPPTTTALLRTIQLPIASTFPGQNGTILGNIYDSTAIGYAGLANIWGGQIGGVALEYSATGASPSFIRQFRMPIDVDLTQPVSAYFTVLTDSGNSANFKINIGLDCLPYGVTASVGTGSAFYHTFGNIATSGAVAFTGWYSPQLVVVSAPVLSGCAVNQLAMLQVSRDNTVASNTNQNLFILEMSLVYTSKY